MQPVAGGLLYSLLHLGGFAGDLGYYSARCAGAARVLELGCGDGRVAAALCLGERPPSVLQRAAGAAPVRARALAAPPDAYVGVELCEGFAAKARERLAPHGGAHVLAADFLAPLPAALAAAPFDAVVVSANTLFCTPRHDALLGRCADALAPGGLLLLDVYNALPWHEEAEEGAAEVAAEGRAEGRAEEAPGGRAAAGAADAAGAGDELVRVQDEEGRRWRVLEREPLVDHVAQSITCTYDFEAAGDGGGPLTEALTHHYALPEQLVRLLDGAGFEIEALDGGFGGEAFDAEESEHVVVAARRRA